MAAALLKYMAWSEDRMVWSAMVWASITGTFFITNVFFSFLDTMPSMRKYKIQPNKTPDKAQLRRCLLEAFVSQLFVRPFAIWCLYPVFARHGVIGGRELPNLLTCLLHFLVMLVVNDTGFYWAHRLLHAVPFLYKHIHKKHHTFITPIGFSAEYSHPIEGLVANGLPTVGGALIMGSHLYLFVAWLVFRMIETVDAHSGYELPFSPFHMLRSIQGGADRHDFHHSHNTGCYGALFTFWDWVCGTNSAYDDWKRKQNAGAAKSQ
jgi:sterol desaturase/sphingolipid hydroxylase (fatty acid hydroxylase superfamily)